MLGFTPLASAALADDGGVKNIAFTATAVATGSPAISTPSITQEHSIDLTSILTSASIVSNASMAEDETFAADSITTQAPDFGSPAVTQEHSLTPTGFTTASPDVDIPLAKSLSISGFNTGVPVFSSVALGQRTNAIEAAALSKKMSGGWPKRGYEVPDGRLVQAEREIQQTYGDVVSIDLKAKSLNKFGKSAEIAANSGLQTIWSVGGNETYVSANDISHVSSSSASDTVQVTIEGHTLSNNEFTFVIQTITLSGQTKVALSTPLARVSRIYNSGSTELVGRVVVYEDTTLSAGVPTDATKIHIDIPAGLQQSFKAATTFSKEDYFIMTGVQGSVSLKQTAAVDFYLEVREVGKVFRQAGAYSASSTGGDFNISLDPALIVPKNADVRIRCETADNNTVAFGIFKGYIAKVL